MVMDSKIRVLLGKPGLDGHDRGMLTGLEQTPEDLVEAALQGDVDVLGLSILSGAHMAIIPGFK